MSDNENDKRSKEIYKKTAPVLSG